MFARPTSLVASTLVLLATYTSAAAEPRTWTDSTGKFSIEAELVEINDQGAVLKNVTGKVVTVPISRLSAEDQQYLQSLESETGAAQPQLEKTLTVSREAPRGPFRNHPQEFQAMVAVLELTGEPILGTTEFGQVRIAAADNEGKDLRLLAAAGDGGGDARREYVDRFVFSDSDKTEDKLKIHMLLDGPSRSATHLAQIQGSVKLKRRDLSTVVVDDVMWKLNKSLTNPELKRVGKMSVEKPSPQDLDDVDTGLAVTLVGSSRHAIEVALLDGQGEKISTGSFSFTTGRTTKWLVGREEKLPADTKLQITLGSAERTVLVPFQFKNLSLGGGAAKRRLEQPRGLGNFFAFAFSPDGTTVAGCTGTYQQTGRAPWGGHVVLWNPTSGKLTKRLGNGQTSIVWVGFSGDGTALASATENGEVILWDVSTGELLHTLTIPFELGISPNIVLSADGKTLAVVVRKPVPDGAPSVHAGFVCDVASGKVIWRLPESNSSEIALSPDGRTFAAQITEVADRQVASREIRLYSFLTGQHVGTLDPTERGVDALAYSPDGQYLVGLNRGSVLFWSASDGSLLKDLERSTSRSNGSWALSADGEMMVCSDFMGRHVELWNLENGRPEGQLTFESSKDLSNVAFAPNLKSLVCEQEFWPVVIELTHWDEVEPAPDEGGVARPNQSQRAVGRREPTVRPPSPEQRDQAVAAIEALGGKCTFSRDGVERVTSVSLTDTSITNAHLQHVKILTTIGSLHFDGAQISDADLAQLKELPNLSSLVLSRTQVTDAGLAQLKELPNLSSLVLSSTQVTDAGLEHLQALTNLTQLKLDNTRITDVGLASLQRLPNLVFLQLDDTQVSDAGLAQIAKMPRLHWLYLGNTKVTDVGVERLKELASLERVHLNDTQVTDEGVRALQNALPRCNVVR